MPALNYTTAKTVGESIGDITSLLAKHGAARISTDYEENQPSGMTFTLLTPHGPRVFSLPVDVTAMERLLAKQEADGAFRQMKQARGKFTTREHAARVAWRVVKDWLEVHMTLVEAQQASLDQAMLGYLHVNEVETLYDVYKQREDALALPEGHQ